ERADLQLLRIPSGAGRVGDLGQGPPVHPRGRRPRQRRARVDHFHRAAEPAWDDTRARVGPVDDADRGRAQPDGRPERPEQRPDRCGVRRLVRELVTRAVGGRAARLAREQRGFSMFAVILLLLVLSVFAAATWAMANGDISASAKDQHRNAAFDAAEAGLNYYLFHLNQDNAYWTQCDQVPGPGGGQPNPVVQAW